MKIVALIIILIVPFMSLSQDCWDVRDEALGEIISLYNTKKLDSISGVIKRWSDQCDVTEELFRVRVLDEIMRDGNLSLILDSNALGFIKAYESKDLESLIPYYFAFTYQNYSVNDEFNEITKVWAKSLKGKNLLEAAFLDLYGSDDYGAVWRFLKKNQGDSNRLQKSFDLIVSESKKEDSFYFGVQAGTFFHPEAGVGIPQFGLQMGKISKRRFGIVSTIYRTGRNEEIELKRTDNNVSIGTHSWYLGYDYGLIEHINNHNRMIFVSASNTYFLTRYDEEEGSKTLPATLGLGAGLALEWPISPTENIGLEIRTNPLNINYGSSVRFNSSFVSLSLKWSSRTARINDEFLKPIGYFE